MTFKPVAFWMSLLCHADLLMINCDQFHWKYLNSFKRYKGKKRTLRQTERQTRQNKQTPIGSESIKMLYNGHVVL